MGQQLEGRVAVVTGASRGIGKGIAVELGANGATVYVTGRTTAEGGILPGTVGQTAKEIDELGGRGIALACDHRDDDAVAKVFEQVRAEQGRLDILVNNVFSSPDLAPWLGKNFWELPIEAWDQCIDIGVRSHYVAAALGVPLMLETGPGSDRQHLVARRRCLLPQRSLRRGQGGGRSSQPRHGRRVAPARDRRGLVVAGHRGYGDDCAGGSPQC